MMRFTRPFSASRGIPALAFAFAFVLAWVACSPVPAEEPKLQVLVVTGGHDYDEAEFDAMWKADAGIDYHHEVHPKALETITSAAIDRFDAVVLYDMYQPITEAQKAAYAKVFLGGKGLLVLHHAIANFQAWPEYERLIGARYFTQDTEVGGVKHPVSTYLHDVDFAVDVVGGNHFITRGLSSFKIHDETYNGFLVRPSVEVLLRAKHPTSGPVIGWAKPYGKARVVYIQLGHDKQAYATPEYRTLLARSLKWVARRTEEDRAFRSLFNGKDLSGWKVEGGARFTIEDGIIVGRQGPGNVAGDLFTEGDLGDFECEVTWAMDWPGNSGVWFRYQSAAKAYQADILEFANPECYSGTVYNPAKMFLAMNTDKTTVDKTGWNVLGIRCEKDHLVVHLNGRKVADVRDSDSRLGKLGFQVHPGLDCAPMVIRVADVRVRTLP
jgi:type 1 glutamine amidotransferase